MSATCGHVTCARREHLFSVLKQAAHKLLAEIDLATDCMSNQIKRERIEHQLEVLEHVLGVDVGEKTYHADPDDHDAVAKALLEKYKDQQEVGQ